MRAYVINLARSRERRAHIVAQLAKCSIDYEFVEAIDHRTLSLSDPRIAELITPSFFGREGFRIGIAAAALSHLSGYRKILADGPDLALVLEDDGDVPGDLAGLAGGIAEQLGGAEVALLNFERQPTCKLSRRGAVDLPGRRQLMSPASDSVPVSGAAYVITRDACQRLVSSAPPVWTQPDDWARFYSEGLLDQVRCVVPMPVTKNPDYPSTIDYNPDSGLKSRLLDLIARHDLGIAKSAASYRRLRIWRRYTRVEFVD